MTNDPGQQESERDSTIHIVSFDDVELIDTPAPDEFDALTDTRIRNESGAARPAVPLEYSRAARASDNTSRPAQWGALSRVGAIFPLPFVIAARRAFDRISAKSIQLASAVRGLVEHGMYRGSAWVADLARQRQSRLLTTRMSVDEIARLNVLAAYQGSSASTVVRTLVLQEYQKLARSRRHRAPPPLS